MQQHIDNITTLVGEQLRSAYPELPNMRASLWAPVVGELNAIAQDHATVTSHNEQLAKRIEELEGALDVQTEVTVDLSQKLKVARKAGLEEA